MAYFVKNVTSYPPKHKVLTPDDDVTFDYPTTILVLDTGNVAVADEDGNVVTYTDVPAFTTIPVAASKLMQTNTTATSFVGLYGDD